MLVQQFSRWRYRLRRSFRSNLSGGYCSCPHGGRWFLFICSSVISWKLAKVECGIDAWATGINVEVPFYSSDYKPLYLRHVKTLKAFGVATSKYDLLGKLQRSLFNFGRYVLFVYLFQFSNWSFLRVHAGVPCSLTLTKNGPMLSQTAFEEALFEYEHDEETEEDGEELD